MIEETYYRDEIFEKINLSDQVLGHIEYDSCRFKNCVFDAVDMSNCKFEACEFINCAILTPKLNNTVLIDVEFYECKIAGALFGTLNTFIVSFSIRYSKMLSCSFSNLSISNMSFEYSQLDDISFVQCDLKKTSFENVIFSGGQIINCDLQGANFLNATGFQIDPSANKMKKAKFTHNNAIELLNVYKLQIL